MSDRAISLWLVLISAGWIIAVLGHYEKPQDTCRYDYPPPNRRHDKYGPHGLIYAAGFPAETHKIVTKDGYILTLHRVANKGRMPVFILHGILCSSRDWLMQRGNNSLPFQLYNAGYDVWLGNLRGNQYSKQHVTLSNKDRKYWDFSWDQSAHLDVPTSIDYILKVTGFPQLHCMGHSMGVTTHIAAMTRGLLGDKCRNFIGMAPVVRNHESTSLSVRPPGFFTRPEQPLKKWLYLLEPTGMFTPRSLNFLLRTFVPTLCRVDIVGICSAITYITLGPIHPSQIDWRMERRIFHGFPTTTSIRTYIQVVRPSVDHTPFTMYKFQTPEENFRHYGQSTPPMYNLTNVHTPLWLFIGEKDYVAPPADVVKWIPEVGSAIKSMNIIKDPNWAHLDFLWGRDACRKVYKPIIDILLRSDAQAQRLNENIHVLSAY